MTKQVNPNIGHIACPICNATAAVRRNKSGRFYFDCLDCGRITPNHSGGQRFVLDKATIWGAGGPPADVPAWIREQWSYGRSLRDGKTQHVDAPPAANDQAPDKMSAPAAAAPGRLPPPPAREAAPDGEVKLAKVGGFSFLD